MTNEIALKNNEDIHQILPPNLENSLFSPALAPHYLSLSTRLARSGIIPRHLQGKPDDIFVAMALAYRVGIPIEQGLQDIAVINGRPTWWGDGALAIVRSHPDFVDIIEEPIKDIKSTEVIGYSCTIKRKNQSDTCRQFTLNDAKKANLLNKAGPWREYPTRMLQMRARSWAMRDAFGDALHGMQIAEEVQDYVDGEVVQTSRTEQLKNQINQSQGMTNEDSASISDKNMPMDSVQTTSSVSEKTDDSDSSSERMDAVECEKGEAISEAAEDKKLLISEVKVEEILTLFADLNFEEEQIGSVLTYYEVDALEELTEEKATHLITKLRKRIK